MTSIFTCTRGISQISCLLSLIQAQQPYSSCRRSAEVIHHTEVLRWFSGLLPLKEMIGVTGMPLFPKMLQRDRFEYFNMEENMREVLLKLGLALLIGTIIGTEREYKNKAAGLRTLILICLGSTLFTILSSHVGAPNETGRIASNIVTGIGFLGAGAIMREGLTVSGLTTASSIWVTAALGMAVGAGQYYLSFMATFIVLSVLTLFGFIQPLLDHFKKTIELHITLASENFSVSEIEKEMKRYELKFEKIKAIKIDGHAVFQYEISGPKDVLNSFLKTLNENKSVRSFEY